MATIAKKPGCVTTQTCKFVRPLVAKHAEILSDDTKFVAAGAVLAFDQLDLDTRFALIAQAKKLHAVEVQKELDNPKVAPAVLPPTE